MIHAGVGLSKKLSNHREAGGDAASAAIEGLPDKKPDILFVFASIKYDQEEVLKGIREQVPDSPLVGGSSAGEIASSATVFDAVVVLAVASDTIRFTPGLSRGVSKDSFKAGEDAARAVLEQSGEHKPSLFISIPDGIMGDGMELVKGIQAVLGESFPIIGGSSGDDYLFRKTYEYFDGQVYSDALIGIGLSGAFSYGFGIRHGWEEVGLPMQVTKAKGTLLQEIDGKPAIEVYQSYFGKDALDLIREPMARMTYTYPLGLKVEGSDELLIRDPLFANEEGEITMAAAIPEGSEVYLMIGDRERAMEATRLAAANALAQLEGAEPRLILVFNCMARNKLLGMRCHEENQIIQEVIGRNVPMAGFYTYGEIGPLLEKKGTPAYFHNETMTILVLGE